MNINFVYLKYFLIYLGIINISAFLSMYIDKMLSIKHKWRIREKSLFMFALFLGSTGSIIGMYTFRHKTKHTSFVVGMPVIFILNLITIYFIFKTFLITV